MGKKIDKETRALIKHYKKILESHKWTEEEKERFERLTQVCEEIKKVKGEELQNLFNKMSHK